MTPSRAVFDELEDDDNDAEAEAGRERRADFIRSAIACIAWAAIGIYCLAWSVHTTDPTLGSAAFFAGIGLGNGGVIFTLLAAYRRGERRGDW